VVEEFLQPLMSLMKTVPVASFVVLILIWWGSGLLAVVTCFLVVLPNIYINTLEGLKATDGHLLEMAEVFRMPARNRFLFIYRPAILPFLESGMKLALGMCWKSGVAAEVIGMPAHSIGGQIYLSKIHLDMAGVLAWTSVVIMLSICFEWLVLRMMQGFFIWSPSAEFVAAKAKRTVAVKAGAISAYGVTKSFGQNKLLSNYSVRYESGELYYLKSPSGSGKTTWLRILCGLERPDEGEVQGVGDCGMVFQEDRLCEEYSVLLNVAMVAEDVSKAKESLVRLLGAQVLTQPCKELSGGMKRRVALVRAMEAASDVVLLDEPFTGMDADTRMRTEEYIREKQRGRTIIIATHI
jgi:NitT/TauT family transport system permease protein